MDTLFQPLGAWAIARLRYAGSLLVHLARGLAAIGRPEGRDVVRRSALQQIYFTGVDAVPVVASLALMLGALVIVQSLSVLTGASGELLLGTILELVVVRELGPLMTAIIVIGRSGSSVAVELGNMQVDDEVELLRSMGVDVHRYLVLPRLVGMTSATFCLCLIFDLVAMLGGYMVARLAVDTPLLTFLGVVGAHLTLTDILLTGVKTVLFGLWISTVSTWHGLAVEGAFTEVPQATRRAVVHGLVGCLVLNGAISASVLAWGL